MKKILLVCMVLSQACRITAAVDPYEDWLSEPYLLKCAAQDILSKRTAQKVLQKLVADHFNVNFVNKTNEVLRVLTIDGKTNRFSPDITILPHQTKSLFLKHAPVLYLPTLSAAALIVRNSYDTTQLMCKTYSLDLFENTSIPPHVIIKMSIKGNPEALDYEICLKRYLEKNPAGNLIDNEHYYQLGVKPLDPHKKMAATAHIVLKGEDFKQSCVECIDNDIQC